MSRLHFSDNLFLGLAELNRFQQFLDDEGFKRHALINTDSFGIIEGVQFPDLGSIDRADNFYVSKAGTPFGDVVIGTGVAMDSDAQLIVNRAVQNLSIPANSSWYWIRIQHQIRYHEVGTVSVDASGNLSGTGTAFTEALRGQPNYPSKIRFRNSTNGNSSEYEVVSVTDNENAILSGDFNAESDLEYIVVGTFTPGSVPSEKDKDIFRYDSVSITLVQETTFNQEPAKTQNQQFYIARVRNNGTTLSLQDRRSEWWRSKTYGYLRNIDRISQNPLIGVEAVKYDVETSPRHQNWVEVGFGFRFSSYTIDTAAKKISILIGEGGIYKDTSYFQNGKFNGWRLYSKNGDYDTIIDSQKSGSQIVLTLDSWNPNNDTGFAAEVEARESFFIAPPYEEIEIYARFDPNPNALTKEVSEVAAGASIPLLNETFSFPINTPIARFLLPTLKSCYKYNLTYRYKVQNDYTDWLKFPDDTVGFYDESSFDVNGVLETDPGDRNRKLPRDPRRRRYRLARPARQQRELGRSGLVGVHDPPS